MNIGIIGRARVGKDTAGAWLVENRGYRRVAFADPLKEAALKLDPIVSAEQDARLREVVELEGWERTKDTYPEVRRILQELGAAVRAIDPDFWLRAALAKVTAANEDGVPAVITDVRYPNEVESLRRAGFHLIHISRPGAPQLVHESEGALGPADADYRITNDGTVPRLHARLEAIVDRITDAESRRHYARSL
ncbi:hypothetical protein ABT096_29755 [Streptomyces sp. NPDC002561]|uniref:deoxynucleotide monophosphate kinase family protein n=1 Tax=Streptomyces sp. NPDC002561 TaxID=3154418 RepID=UPI00331C7916